MDTSEQASPRDTARQGTQRLLRQERSAQSLVRLMEQAFAHITRALEHLPEQATLACAQGCSFCCYHPVDLTPAEAFVIVAYLRTALAPNSRDAVCARIASQAEYLRGLSYQAHAQAKIPCALLVDGQCAVYPCRPFACRAWNSTAVARCQDIFTHGNPITMLPPLVMSIYETVWEAARGVADGLQTSRLTATSYELHSILQRVLTTPDAEQRWLQGEAIFAGCTVGAFSE